MKIWIGLGLLMSANALAAAKPYKIAVCSGVNEETNTEESLNLYATADTKNKKLTAITVYGDYHFNSLAGNGHGYSKFNAKIMSISAGHSAAFDLSVSGTENIFSDGHQTQHALTGVFIDPVEKTVSLQTKDQSSNSKPRTIRCSEIVNLSLFR